jgi:hypothetical protein
VTFKKELAVQGLLVGGLCIVLFALASCHTIKPPKLPYPPGFVAHPIPSPSVIANVPRPVQRAMLVSPAPNVVLTCDIDLTGPFDGVHVYAGPQPTALGLLATFDHTNVFPVNVPTNVPTFLEVRTFINWQAPGIVQTCTNDDGSTGAQTITFREGPINRAPTFSDYIFVPTNCQVIALMAFTNGLQLVGWGAAGAVYQIQSSADLAAWSSNATVTGTNGPYRVLVDSSQPQTFWRTVH